MARLYAKQSNLDHDVIVVGDGEVEFKLSYRDACRLRRSLDAALTFSDENLAEFEIYGTNNYNVISYLNAKRDYGDKVASECCSLGKEIYEEMQSKETV